MPFNIINAQKAVIRPFIPATQASNSQDTVSSWAELMANPTVNYYDVQRAFYDYWEGKVPGKGKGYKVFKRWEDFMAPRVYPTGNRIDPAIADKELSNYLMSHPQNKSTTGNWVCLGPQTPTGSASNGSYQGPGGCGRINCMAFHPTDANTFWVGAPSGGLWKTTDGGKSWSTATDQLAVIGISEILIDPTNPNIMYIATGDRDAGDTYSTGILKSNNGGVTWNTTSLSYDVTSNAKIYKIVMSTGCPTIQIAVLNGISYRTNDGWATKIVIPTLPDIIFDIEYKPGDPNTVYAVGSISGAVQFYKSTDGGGTFSLTGTGLPTIGAYRVAIAVSPAASSNVWALVCNDSDYGFHGFFTSTNSGATFSTTYAVGAGHNLLGYETNFSDAGGQGWYDLTLAVNPTNALDIFAGGVNLQKSTNGGTSWVCNGYWLQGNGTYQYTHADHHDFEFYNGTTVYDCTDGGIFKSTDKGANWSDISGNMTIAQVACIGISANNKGLIMTGMQDNGTNKLISGVWSAVYGGDGCETFCDPGNDNILYCSYVYGDLRRSIDQGSNWSYITPGTATYAGWIVPWCLHPTTATTIYSGFDQLFKSTNSGTSWVALGSLPGPTDVISCFAVAPSSPTTIYAAKANLLYKTTNDGVNWTDKTGTLPVGSATITSIAVSATDPNKAWVTFSGYASGMKVYSTIDGGTTWTNISATLPNLPVNTIVYQKASGNDQVYIGTDIGVYYRNNGLSDWVMFSNKLPRVVIKELEIFYGPSSCENKIRAATYGRGIWESDLLDANTLSYSSSTTTQNTNTVTTGSTKEQVIGISVVMSNCGSPVNITNFELSTNGTTLLSDISNARIYYTGATNAYSTDNQFGSTVASPGASYSIAGTQSLAPGANYFWLTYDIAAGATVDNTVDAECTHITVNGSAYAPAITAPTGNRQIKKGFTLSSGDLANYNYGPAFRNTASSTTDYSRHEYLITAAELTTAGIPNGSKISKIEWYKTSSYATRGNATFSIYMKNSSKTVLTTATSWASIISGANQVYNSTTQTFPATSGWIPFVLTPYIYTGNALEIAVSWDISAVGGSPTTGPFYWGYSRGLSANLGIGAASATALPTTLNTTTYGGTVRPFVRIEYCIPPDAAGTITGTASVCQGQSGVAFSVPAITRATGYTWSLPTGATIASGTNTNSITVNFSGSALSGNVTVYGTNTCTNGAISPSFPVTVNVLPGISGTTPGSRCGTGTVDLGATPTGGTVNWYTVASGGSSQGSGNSYTTPSISATTTYYVDATENGCTTATRSSVVATVNSFPGSAGAISGSATVTQGQSGVSYSVSPVANATSHIWDYSGSGATINGSSENITIDYSPSATSGNLTVKGNNSCGDGATSPLFAITVNASSGTTTFSGSANWNNAPSWSEGVPDASKNAIIDGNATVTATANCKNLTINETRSLTLNSLQILNVNGDFLIKSSASGEGLFNDKGGTLNVTGTRTVQRYLTAGKWHIVSSPVTNALAGVFTGIYLKYFDEPAQQFTWITSVSDNLNAGRGYFAWATSDRTVSYAGQFNTGSVNIPVTISGNHWNLAGNPYPCNVDWAIGSGWTKTTTTGSMYIWDPLYNGGDYRSHNGTVGSPIGTPGIIPSGQGFWVEATSAGNLVINNNAKTTTSQSFYKSIETPSNLIRLRTEKSTFANEAVIYFDIEGTNGYDPDIDTRKILSTNVEIPQIYSLSPDSDLLCINVLGPLPNNISVPLGISSAPGAIVLTAFDFSVLDSNVSVILEDSKIQQYSDIRLHPVYNFTHDTLDGSRFILHFSTEPDRIGNNPEARISIYSYSHNIYINNWDMNKIRVLIYDLLGNEVIAADYANGLHKIPMLKNSSGQYIVRVVAGGNLFVKKVMIY